MKNNKGQTLYYFLILTVILVISWAMMLNIACLIRDRIRLQNEADGIALSLATYKARVLNFLGSANYLIGEALSLGMNPRITQLASYSTDVIGGFPATMNPSFENPLSDLKHETFGHKKDEGVRKIKFIIDTIQKAQDLAVKSYYSYHCSILADNISKDCNILLFPSRPEKNLGLKRNSKGINYYSTINLACIYLDASMHFHILSRNKRKQSKYSWFVEGDRFSEQKVKVVLRKKINGRKPLFAKFIGIHYPQIMTFSAASPYNVKGSMFPKIEDSFTGATKTTMVLSEAASLSHLALMERAIANASSFGPAAVPFIAAAEAAVALNYLESKMASAQLLSGKDNPIDAYLKAKSGGWSAHLVPYGKNSNAK
ncbi:MAG: hypothetical protein LBS61_03030 [Endomicrobium sp.]|nr:hypothetical protein [Endomicrobium sp.]